MPRPKDQSLHTRHSTKSEIEARTEADASMQSTELLSEREPYELKDHKVAAKVWRRTVKEFNGLEARILTKQDYDLMIDYCLTMESLKEIDGLRASAIFTWKFLDRQFQKAVKDHEDVEAKLLAARVVAAFDSVKTLDARVDAKRKYLLQVRQSLYLTPRSRTGQAPEKKKELPASTMFEQMLNAGLPTINQNEQGDES